MLTSVATVLGTIAFVIQNIIEFLKPVLERYISWFDFSDIKVVQRRVKLLDVIYKNTLSRTEAKDIEIEDNNFKFDSKMSELIDLRNTLTKKVQTRTDSKSRRYTVLGVILGVLICFIFSRFTGLTFFGLDKTYEVFKDSNTYRLVDTILAGLLVGFGSKPVNDLLSYFNKNKRGQLA